MQLCSTYLSWLPTPDSSVNLWSPNPQVKLQENQINSVVLNALDLGKPHCSTNQVKTNNMGSTKPHFRNQASNDAERPKFTLQLTTATPHTGRSKTLASLLRNTFPVSPAGYSATGNFVFSRF